MGRGARARVAAVARLPRGVDNLRPAATRVGCGVPRQCSDKSGLFKMLKGMFSICQRIDARLDNIEKRQNVLSERQKAIYNHLPIETPRVPL